MGTSKSKKIVIITTSPFPIGLTGTNRILSYCSGFLINGYQTEVICIRPTETYNNVFNISPSGIYQGIGYSYPGKTTVRVKSFWGRRWNDNIAVISSIVLYINLLQKKDIHFSIFLGNNILAEILFILITRVYRKKIYKEESENPNVYFKEKGSIPNRFINWFVINRLYRYYDCVLVITLQLNKFFIGKGVPEAKILLVPQTVDLTRFESTEEKKVYKINSEYIAYAGSLNQKKDGVLTLIESFQRVSEKFPELKLFIAGGGTSEENMAILSLIENLKVAEKVSLMGRISSEEIPQFLKCAKVLVSCRPSSIQSDYGFPTKTVEYLATGKPTVTTLTGELAFYLKDRETAFVVNKTEPDEVALKILEVLQDYDFALKVAESGKDLVRDKFSPIIQTKKIIDFCKE